jgi:hypothetical protein
MATDVKLKDYILYKYKEKIKEKNDSLYYTSMLSIISSDNRGAAVPQCLYVSRPWLRVKKNMVSSSEAISTAVLWEGG